MAIRAMAVAAGPVVTGSLCSTSVSTVSSRRVSTTASTSFHPKYREQVFSRGIRRIEPVQAPSVQKNRFSFSEQCNAQRASAARGEFPEAISEDEKFVPLNEDDPRYGPAALFLLGFGNSDAVRVQEMLQEMEGDFLRIVLCTPEMIKGTLGQALNTDQPNTSVRVAKDLPQICFLSGVTGEEIMMLIQAFREVGFADTVFAAHVPKNTDKSLEELIEEIMGDHERLTKSRQPTVA